MFFFHYHGYSMTIMQIEFLKMQYIEIITYEISFFTSSKK